MVRRQRLQICQMWHNCFLLEIFQICEFKEFLKGVILIYNVIAFSRLKFLHIV